MKDIDRKIEKALLSGPDYDDTVLQYDVDFKNKGVKERYRD